MQKFVCLLEKQVAEGVQLVSRQIKVTVNPMARTERDHYIDEKALEQLRADYHQWRDYNIEILRQAFTNNGGEYLEKYQSCGRLAIYSTKNKADQMKEFITDEINELRSMIKRAELLDVTNDIQEYNQSDVDKVFVVYGHDREMKLEVENFLRSKLKVDVVALDEQPNGGRTIIEKFEQCSKESTFAVVLMSPDDDAEVDGQIFKRARQNVVLELGYFMAKLGRNKVCVLVRGNVEKPSDISGVLYLSYDGEWKFDLLAEMKNAGVTV